jgi:DNA mismatch repair protein MutS2
MKEVADKQLKLQQREVTIAQKEKEYNDGVARYEKLTHDLESKKKEIITQAKEEASKLLSDTNREIEKTIRHIRENSAEKKETRKVRENLKSLVKKISPSEKLAFDKPQEIKPGDHVRFLGQERSGVVQSIKGESAIVQFGEIRATTKLSRLTKSVGEQESKVHSRNSGISLHARQSQFNSTLDVRGQRVDEVLGVLDQFLDDAILLGHSELKILHGKGEGVLRKVIRERLKALKTVTSFHDEHEDRGGAGITVVALK